MNASDIVKNRQNKVLFNAYYQPTIYQSTVISTVSLISSYVGGFNSYRSTTNTVYDYATQSTFLNYELMNEVKRGNVACTGTCTSELTWENLTHTTLKMYSTNYATLSTPLNINVTSTMALRNSGPIVCPMVEFYQGTNFDLTYPTYTGENGKF